MTASDVKAIDSNIDPNVIQVEVAQPLLYAVATLRADVRPLRALFEDLALEVRATLHRKGVFEPQLAATLDLRSADQSDALTVPWPLEIENAAVCLADPLPLDTQALRQAVDTFFVAYEERFGPVRRDAAVQVVMLRVTGRGFVTPLESD